MNYYNTSNCSRRSCCNIEDNGTFITIQGPQGVRGDTGPQGPIGPKGERGEKGDRGPAGEQGPIGEQGPQGEIGPQGVQGDQGCMGPQGEQGIQGPKGDKGDTGEKGDQGEQGIQGPKGDKGDQGIQGEKGDTGEKGEQGIQGPKGDNGDQGIQGEKGDTGEQGVQGEKGENGETPVITVAENTPLSYKLNFKTTGQDITTPNLFAPFTEYHADISAVNSVLSVPILNLVLTYQTTSTAALRIALAPKNTEVQILADIRRTSIYNTGAVEAQTFDSTTVSARIVLDETVYNQSQETHVIRIRQQDPATKLWSLCVINSYISARGARTSVKVSFDEYEVSYAVPTAE